MHEYLIYVRYPNGGYGPATNKRRALLFDGQRDGDSVALKGIAPDEFALNYAQYLVEKAGHKADEVHVLPKERTDWAGDWVRAREIVANPQKVVTELQACALHGAYYCAECAGVTEAAANG